MKIHLFHFHLNIMCATGHWMLESGFHVARTRGQSDWPGHHTQHARGDRTQQQQYNIARQWCAHYFVSLNYVILSCTNSQPLVYSVGDS